MTEQQVAAREPLGSCRHGIILSVVPAENERKCGDGTAEASVLQFL